MAVGNAVVALDLSPLDRIEKVAKQRGITLKAVRVMGRIVQRAAKARAPKRKGSGALKQSIGLKAAKGKRSKTLAFVVVGARKGVVKMVPAPRGRGKIKAVPAFYAHLVELGTRPHAITKGSRLGRNGRPDVKQEKVKHPGAKPRPFLRPAWDATQREALAAGQQVLAAEIAKELAKGK